MEACVEALFSIDGGQDKRKTLEMIRILKGAVSVSKSRTGEVISRYNRHEKKALNHLLAKYDRETAQSSARIDNQKRDILRKWNLVFGRQRNFCESIRSFDEMLEDAIVNRHNFKSVDNEAAANDAENADDSIGKENNEENKEEQTKAEVPQIVDPRQRRLPGQHSTPSQPTVAGPVILGVLPKLNITGNLHNSRIETKEEELARLEKEAEEQRKQKAKELPRFDKELMQKYLDSQKSLQEDLITRNTLLKIKSTLDCDHVFFKYRMKTQLPASAPELLQHIEHERALSVTTPRGFTCSRFSTYHQPSSTGRRSSRSLKSRSGVREERTAREKHPGATNSTQQPTQNEYVQSTDRVKNVHFN